ncbi:hypothetical protein BDW59DRAFT_157002 [Aspergillus cavernicola]|uniref:Uncharacterized protein n=1 Tax=Aspergillus cavernicola TaxID=176166 RepID=A0ABR4IYK4_9EURO
MCHFWQAKYLCACIHDEWYTECKYLHHAKHPDYPTPGTRCIRRQIFIYHDIFSFCEECYGELDRRIKRDGVKNVLTSGDTYPVADKLGMLIVLIGDRWERWKVFRRRREGDGWFGWDTYRECGGVVLPLTKMDLRNKTKKAEEGQAAWKYR